MSANKHEPPTKTIAFRWPTNVVNQIKALAKEKGITMQDFFVTQISPSSDLMKFIVEEQEKMLLESKAVADTRDRMVEDVKRMMESTNLSEDSVIDAFSQAIKLLVKGDKTQE